jgi:hypothetical protein
MASIPIFHALKSAKQTLIVRDAPPDLKLDQPIPLPLLESWSQIMPVAPPVPAPPPKAEVIAKPDPSHQVDGTLMVPKVNQIAAEAGLPSVTGGSSDKGREGQTNPASQPQQGLADLSKVPPGDKAAAPDQPHESQAIGPNKSPADQTGADQLNLPAGKFTRIDLPRDSKSPVSVLGESVAEQFPESAGRMSSRVVSTVYLRMGLKKNWTLEYCLPADAPNTSAKGGASILDAPWPYTIFRPDNLWQSLESDVILIHGVLTVAGRFDQLTLLLPAEWPGRQSLFEALRVWKFRPAAKNGQPVAVEVMLVIPRQPEEDQ